MYYNLSEVKTMAANALVQTRIDAEVKERATAVLEAQGMTVSEAVRILLTRTAKEGALPFAKDDEADSYGNHDREYDAWFRAKVQEALNDPRPTISHEEMRERMASRRAAAMARLR